MIKKALQFVGRKLQSALGFASRQKTLEETLQQGARPTATRTEWLRERRRRHCMRNQLVFGAPRGTKSHRRFYYRYNPSWFTKPEFTPAN